MKYPAGTTQLKKARKAQRPAKLRPSLVPGTVLIILAGRFRGKRVVLLKALESGLLLVSGPFKINGVPLRRVNHKYVIATSTRVELPSSLSLDKFDSAYFAREQSEKTRKGEADFFKDNKPISKTVAEARIADQKQVDGALLQAIKQVPSLKEYLSASFSLSKGDRPHLMKF